MSTRTAIGVVAGIVVGVLALAAARFLLVPVEQPPHYHANFAIFVDGRRINLSGNRYMEEVSACRVHGDHVLPTERVHLHNNNPDVVHVHHQGVTWGHFLANLGFDLGDRYLALEDSLYVQGQNKTLKLIRNGRPEYAVDNELIRSGDRLLISYGAESEQEVVRKQFPAVAANAEEYNSRADPAGCSGSQEPGMWDRVRRAFWG